MLLAKAGKCWNVPSRAVAARVVSVRSLSTGIHVIKPETLPSSPLRLNPIDVSMMHFPGVTTHNLYRGHLAVDRLFEALQRVVANNPWLAGRICTASDGGLEVRYDGPVGATFTVNELTKPLEARLEYFQVDKLVKEPLEWEALVRELGISNTGPGPLQVDKDAPVLCASYLHGQDISMVSLSVSHLVGDGSTKMQLLRAWDEEVANPGSTEPMSGREGVGAAEEHVMSTYTPWEQSAAHVFNPAIYAKHNQNRDLTKYHMVVVRIKQSTMQRLKASEMQKVPAPTFSAQDALIAFLGNTLGAKWFCFTVDLRGRIDQLPRDAAGNAFMTWYGTPEGGPGNFNATDVRNTINQKGAGCAAALEEALFTGLDQSIDVNSWVKLQHRPTFGGKLRKQMRAMGFSSLPFLFRLNYHVVYQPEDDDFIMFHFGLLRDEAETLKAAWNQQGVDLVRIVSPIELLQKIASMA